MPYSVRIYVCKMRGRGWGGETARGGQDGIDEDDSDE